MELFETSFTNAMDDREAFRSSVTATTASTARASAKACGGGAAWLALNTRQLLPLLRPVIALVLMLMLRRHCRLRVSSRNSEPSSYTAWHHGEQKHSWYVNYGSFSIK